MRSKGHHDKEGWLLRAYTRLVGWSVRHQYIAVALGLGIFAASIGSFFLLPSGFLPTEDTGRTLLAIELPPGSRLDDTRAVTGAIAREIGARPDVKSVYVNGGRVMGGVVGASGEVRKATLVINLVPRAERKLGQAAIKEEVSRSLARVPDIRFWFLLDNGRQQIQLVVSGRDAAAVNRVAAEMTSQAKRIPLIANVVSSAELDRPELRVVPVGDVAADVGVSTEAIAEAVRIATIGDVGANLAKFDVGDRQVPIRVQLDERARAERQVLESLKVATTSGATVPLSAIARFELAQGPTAIDRYDRTRRVLVGADLVGNAPLGKAVGAMLALPAAKSLPAGVELKQFGDAEIMGEVFAGFAAAMSAGIMMVYAVLVLLFGSFLQPVTILFSLPLSIGGAIVALAVAGQSISLPVVIGILMLMGIVTKNAIMLVDFAIESMHRGTPRTEAIVDAGRKRARPIVMTTIAMVAGMLPAAVGLDSGGEFRAPMSIAVIGGLLSSTLLSLVFVPAVFAVMDDIGRLVWHVFSRFVGPTEEDVEPAAGAAPAMAMVRAEARSLPAAAE
jgi:multidrug efflux pump subunit AcrB